MPPCQGLRVQREFASAIMRLPDEMGFATPALGRSRSRHRRRPGASGPGAAHRADDRRLARRRAVVLGSDGGGGRERQDAGGDQCAPPVHSRLEHQAVHHGAGARGTGACVPIRDQNHQRQRSGCHRPAGGRPASGRRRRPDAGGAHRNGQPAPGHRRPGGPGGSGGRAAHRGRRHRRRHGLRLGAVPGRLEPGRHRLGLRRAGERSGGERRYGRAARAGGGRPGAGDPLASARVLRHRQPRASGTASRQQGSYRTSAGIAPGAAVGHAARGPSRRDAVPAGDRRPGALRCLRAGGRTHAARRRHCGKAGGTAPLSQSTRGRAGRGGARAAQLGGNRRTASHDGQGEPEPVRGDVPARGGAGARAVRFANGRSRRTAAVPGRGGHPRGGSQFRGRLRPFGLEPGDTRSRREAAAVYVPVEAPGCVDFAAAGGRRGWNAGGALRRAAGRAPGSRQDRHADT